MYSERTLFLAHNSNMRARYDSKLLGKAWRICQFCYYSSILI